MKAQYLTARHCRGHTVSTLTAPAPVLKLVLSQQSHSPQGSVPGKAQQVPTSSLSQTGESSKWPRDKQHKALISLADSATEPVVETQEASRTPRLETVLQLGK